MAQEDSLKDQTFDVVLLGTSLTNCILSGLLSVEGKKVLHLDTNNYYGGASASLPLGEFIKLNNSVNTPVTQDPNLGKDRDWNIDLIPKLMMANGKLVRMLMHTKVNDYLQFKQIQGSYVYREGKINKVPVTAMEALNSNLMGFFEKRRAKKFLEFVEGVKEKEQASWQGLHIFQMNVKLMFDYFGLEPGTRDFIGHALALYLDEHYVTLPAWDCIERIQLYTSSLLRFGKSPYVYPLYGLGELPQSFARRSATYGGLFMLDTPVTVNFTENKVTSVQTKEGLVNCQTVISDPSYFNNQVTPAGKVVRAICFLNHTIPDTDNSDSVQIILPQNQVNRKNDIYICMVGASHNVAKEGYSIAIVSSVLDNPTDTAGAEKEIEHGLRLLGPIHQKFVFINELFEPKYLKNAENKKEGLFISNSFDATSHFETVCLDVLRLYKEVIGKDLVLKSWEELAKEAPPQ